MNVHLHGLEELISSHFASRFSALRSVTSIMSCRFIFLLILFPSIFERCFSSIHIPPPRQQLHYAFPSESRHRTHLQRRSTSKDAAFQIHIHYDRSMKKLLRDEQKIIHEAVQMATDYWSRAIRPKFKLNDRIRLVR